MSDDYCEVDFSDTSADSEPVEFYDEKIARARKAHVCTECGAPIAAGDEYQRRSYRFEKEFSVDHVCLVCREIAGEFEHRLIGSLLWENFRVEWDNGARLQGCLNRLTSVAAKELMRAQWLKWQELRERQRREAAERRARKTGDSA